MLGASIATSRSKKRARSPRAIFTLHGFTLIELLVALAIFSVMSVVAYRGLNAVLETREHLMVDNRKWRELAVFFAQMKEGVTNAVDRPVRDSGDLLAPAFLGKPDVVGENDAQLIFTRMGFPGQQGHLGDLQRLGYRLRDKNIELLVWPVLDQAPHTRPTVSKALGNVSIFVVRYLDDKGVWQTNWPVIGQNIVLPRAVEVRLGLESGEQVTRMFAP
ncbi:general secretion pathway protein J [Sulfuricella denitrificans skB26]|uniref:Type II secretion system protein J n=1 Tax=Sulfuricella denitrificans (strain DSM 22764 / NBRC 105220 / skB26) TaxID=1163617 RepID=S6ABZ9_SULDS|nr:type II secretion system minor pseudopilin GspJ [Sulfuricella denitrificans]BAN35148.1 general secretion pathway protein J [Sulfuricella denitrificans skB26]